VVSPKRAKYYIIGDICLSCKSCERRLSTTI